MDHKYAVSIDSIGRRVVQVRHIREAHGEFHRRAVDQAIRHAGITMYPFTVPTTESSMGYVMCVDEKDIEWADKVAAEVASNRKRIEAAAPPKKPSITKAEPSAIEWISLLKIKVLTGYSYEKIHDAAVNFEMEKVDFTVDGEVKQLLAIRQSDLAELRAMLDSSPIRGTEPVKAKDNEWISISELATSLDVTREFASDRIRTSNVKLSRHPRPNTDGQMTVQWCIALVDVPMATKAICDRPKRAYTRSATPAPPPAWPVNHTKSPTREVPNQDLQAIVSKQAVIKTPKEILSEIGQQFETMGLLNAKWTKGKDKPWEVTFDI